jgi:beta-N-acetylhexosaminidase
LPDETARGLERGLAGVVLFARNLTGRGGLGALCGAIRAVKADALIALDEEGGEVTRLQAKAGSSWPGARALGVVDDPALTGAVAAAIASELVEAGANVNFAPVADVLSCAANPVIGNRSFGPDPALVSRHVAEWVRATQRSGVAACAKHFPGHGATRVDSHLDLPVVGIDRSTLMEQHVIPFKAAVDAGVAMLMTAHVVYKGVDERPATLSRTLLHDLARTELGFEGVVVTDALGMGAIARHAGVVAGAVRALSAGADLLCLDGDWQVEKQVLAGIEEARWAGELASGRLDEAVARVDRLASRFLPPASVVHDRAGPELGLAIARRAVGAGPGPLVRAPFVVELDARPTGAGETRMRLLDAFRAHDPATVGLLLHSGDEAPRAVDIAKAAAGRPVVLATRDAHRKAGQARFASEVLAALPDAVLVALGSEADLVLAPGRALAAFGSAPPNLMAVAEVLLASGP